MHFNIKSILSSQGFDNKDHYQNIYINLYEALKKAIINKILEDNTKLPPSRVLSKDIGVSRSTVLKAYDLLVIEKFIVPRVGSGYYVQSTKNLKSSSELENEINLGGYPSLSKRGLAFLKNLHIINNSELTSGIAFRPGLPPLDIFPINQWKNLTNDYWKTVKYSELSYSDTLGIESLRESISNYLKIYRNINCSTSQIVITTGSLHSLSLVFDALINKNDKVVIENPTYPYAYDILKSLKSKICPARIDEEGLVIKDISAKNAKLLYCTPSNQYPTGVKMSLNRRAEILSWASKNGSIIIEDDYDHEFSNWEHPIGSIFSLDKQERVVYLGTFNKLLHPSIRLGYMIVPNFLIDTVTALYRQSTRFVSPSVQKVLNAFIEKDYLNKHLRNLIEVSLERKNVFVKAFIENFEDKILINSKNTGLHIIGQLDDDIKDKKLTQHLKQKGIIAHAYSDYFIGKEKKYGLVMGYSSVNNKIIKETIAKMKSEYSNFLNLY